jgi:phage replication initiation protein
MKCAALLDWVSFTLLDETLPDLIIDRYSALTWKELPRGLHGYARALRSEEGGILVLFDGRSGMGVHVQISGDGCRVIEELGRDWVTESAYWRGCGARCGRLDYAVDDREGLSSYEGVRAHLRAQALTTRWAKTWQENATFQMGDCHDQAGAVELLAEARRHGWSSKPLKASAWTIYLGNKESDARMRCYNKWAEQKLPEGLGHWIRFEWQFRDDRADIVWGLLAEGAFAAIIGVCRSYIEFRDHRLDSNPSMAPAADWWDTLMCYAKHGISIPREVATLERKHAWMERQTAVTVWMFAELEGVKLGGTMGLLQESGRTRARPKDHKILAAARAKYGSAYFPR